MIYAFDTAGGYDYDIFFCDVDVDPADWIVPFVVRALKDDGPPNNVWKLKAKFHIVEWVGDDVPEPISNFVKRHLPLAAADASVPEALVRALCAAVASQRRRALDAEYEREKRAIEDQFARRKAAR